MPSYSICGIDCSTCKVGRDNGCKGCQAAEGRIFWGECELYACAKGKALSHCGKCASFPCEKLREWAKSENPERIDNLRTLV